MPKTQYAYCETAVASPFSKWHIRKLDEAGKKLGGGATTPALCGRVVAWDLAVDVAEQYSDNTCKKCLILYAGEQRGGRSKGFINK